jgi:hypothetical protein
MILNTGKCISENKLAKISRESANKATITWSPTAKEQLTFTENGVKGQFIVQYDVDHNSTPNQVLVCYLFYTFLIAKKYININVEYVSELKKFLFYFFTEIRLN